MPLPNILDALGSLWSAKQRTLLAATGIVIGSGSTVAMVTIGEMVSVEAAKQFESMGPNTMLFMLSGATKLVTPQLIGELPSRFTRLDLVSPVIATSGPWVVGRAHGDSSIIGVDRAIFDIAGTDLAAGRYLSPLDESKPFAVVGMDAFEPEDDEETVRTSIGDEFQLQDAVFTIVGELRPYGTNPMLGIDFDRSILVPVMALRRLGSPASINVIAGSAVPDSDIETLARDVRRYLEQRIQGLSVATRIAQQLLEAIERQTRLLSLLLGSMASISLLVGGIGIMNVMLVAVTERRKEIGLRLAIGATPANIVSLFLVESSLLTTFGGLIGLALGTCMAYVAGMFMNIPYFFSSFSALLGIGVSSAIGLFFGYYPALVASRLNPIDCLQSE